MTVIPAARADERLQTAAAWLFVLPVLTEGVLPGVVKLELAGLAVLVFAWCASGRPLPRRAAEPTFCVAALLTLTVIGYLAFGRWPDVGPAAAYDVRAAMWLVTYAAVAVYAFLFFDREVLARVLWRASVTTLWVSELTCALSRVTGHLILVNPAHGTLRMCGTMTEPAAWGATLAMVLILAWRRRSWLNVCLALAGLYLTASPVCLLVTAASVTLCAVLSAPWRTRLSVLLALAAVVPAGTVWVARADPLPLLDSPTPAKVAAGRLVQGIQAAWSGSDDPAANSRYYDTTASLRVIRDNGWMRAGAGPGADAAWAKAEYPDTIHAPLAVNALWVSVLWDFGEWGVTAMVALVLLALWRIRRDRLLCAVLLPFIVASMVNSAIPDWSVTGLAVMLMLRPSPSLRSG